jgi:hypothetical protein
MVNKNCCVKLMEVLEASGSKASLVLFHISFPRRASPCLRCQFLVEEVFLVVHVIGWEDI